MLKVEPDVLKFIDNYHLHLIAPAEIKKSEFSKFHSELSQVMKYIKYSKDKKTFMENVGEDEDYQNVSKETADVINAVTGYDMNIVPDERGRVNMCDAIKGIKEDARNEGKSIGIYDTLTTLVNQGKLSFSDAAETAHLTVPEFIAKTGLKIVQ